MTQPWLESPARLAQHPVMLRALPALLSLAAAPAAACDTALILAMDVSNSVDVAEYRLQADGLAAAFRDEEITELMVDGEVAVMVIQWSGDDKQAVTIPWTQVRTAADVTRLSVEAAAMPRAFVLSDTAPAEAILFALRQFEDAPDCTARVIDVSGDGTPNGGSEVRNASRLAERAGVTINGIAIESMGLAITNFYARALITRDGFVMTARMHRDYADTLRRKIIRELSQVLG